MTATFQGILISLAAYDRRFWSPGYPRVAEEEVRHVRVPMQSRRPAVVIYTIYQEWRLIELLFRFNQTELDMDDTRVNGDF